MWILFFFAFLAGIATVLSPCIFPVLPALLSAGGGKGRLHPIGIICGLICSFTFFTLALTAIVQLTGISADFLRYLAIACIAGFGLLMIFPSLGDRFAQATSGVANLGQSVQEKSHQLGSGFWSGALLGIALGLVWTPCAGPILAAITTLVATQAVTWSAFGLTLAYSVGAAIPMLLIIYGGQRIISSRYGEEIRKGFGILMIVTALALAFHWDATLQQYLPLINIEDNATVEGELEQLRGSNHALIPELSGITGWINTEPFTLQQLRGKVVLIDFWTYSCINCIRTFPYLKDWDQKYRDKGLVIVGVHTPEFEFEKKLHNVQDAAERFGLKYPIALDSNYKTWLNFNNRYWPAHYLLDQEGNLKSFHFGEGAYQETENEIRTLLGMPPLETKPQLAIHRPITPETYLGSERTSNLATLKGDWQITSEKATATGNAGLDLNFLASNVYLVMESEQPQQITIYLDDLPPREITVHEPRKYDLVKTTYGRHKLILKVPKDVSLYAFTFGDE